MAGLICWAPAAAAVVFTRARPDVVVCVTPRPSVLTSNLELGVNHIALLITVFTPTLYADELSCVLLPQET